MADGKTFALERGGGWRGVVIHWRWSWAKLVAAVFPGNFEGDPRIVGIAAAEEAGPAFRRWQ